MTTSPADEKATEEKGTEEKGTEEKPVVAPTLPPLEQEKPVVPPALPPREHAAPPVPSKQVDGDADAKVVEEDDRVVVTDRTWEDRAWKELTRLKLEMFWARVGGIQIPSS